MFCFLASTQLPTLKELERLSSATPGDSSDAGIAAAAVNEAEDLETMKTDSKEETETLQNYCKQVKNALYTVKETARFFSKRSMEEATQARVMSKFAKSLQSSLNKENKRFDGADSVTLHTTLWRVMNDIVAKTLDRHKEHAADIKKLADPLIKFERVVPGQLKDKIEEWKKIQAEKVKLRNHMSNERARCLKQWELSQQKFELGKSNIGGLRGAFNNYQMVLRAARERQLELHSLESEIVKHAEATEVARLSLLSESRNLFCSSQTDFITHFRDSSELLTSKTKKLKASGIIEGEEDISKAMLDALRKKKEKLNKARTNIAFEVMSTEESYLRSVKIAIKCYLEPLKEAGNKILKPGELDIIFCNIDQIYSINSDFLADLKEKINNWDDEQTIADVFVKWTPYFKHYTEYFNNQAKSTETIAKLSSSNRKFAKFLEGKMQDPAAGGQTLAAVLITPIQRVPRYRLLLQELLRKTHTSHPDYSNLNKALESVKKVASELNAAMGFEDDQRAIVEVQELFGGKSKFIAPHRSLILSMEVVALTRQGSDPALLVLFNDMFIEGRKEGKRWRVTQEIALDPSVEVLDADSPGGWKVRWTPRPSVGHLAALTRLLCPVLQEVAHDYNMAVMAGGIQNVANDLRSFAFNSTKSAASMTVAMAILVEAITVKVPAALRKADHKMADQKNRLTWKTREPNMIMVVEKNMLTKKVVADVVKIELSFEDESGPEIKKKECNFKCINPSDKKKWMEKLAQAVKMADSNGALDEQVVLDDNEDSETESDSDDEDLTQEFSRKRALHDGKLATVEAPLFEYGMQRIYGTLAKMLAVCDYSIADDIIKYTQVSEYQKLTFGQVLPLLPPLDPQEEEKDEDIELEYPTKDMNLEDMSISVSRCLWTILTAICRDVAERHRSYSQEVFQMTDALDAFIKEAESKRRDLVAKWTKVQYERRTLNGPILNARRACKNTATKLVMARRGIKDSSIAQLRGLYQEYESQLELAYQKHRGVYNSEQALISHTRKLTQKCSDLVRDQRSKAFRAKRDLLHRARSLAAWLMCDSTQVWVDSARMQPSRLEKVCKEPETLASILRPVRPHLIQEGLPVTQLDFNLYKYLDVLLAAKGRLPVPGHSWTPKPKQKALQPALTAGGTNVKAHIPGLGTVKLTAESATTGRQLREKLENGKVARDKFVMCIDAAHQTFPEEQTVNWALQRARAAGSKGQTLEIKFEPLVEPKSILEGYVNSSKDHKKKKYGAPKWLCLLEGSLLAYAKKDDKAPKFTLPLTQTTQVDVEYNSNGHSMFSLAENDTAKKYYVIGADEDEMQLWMTAIRGQIAKLGKFQRNKDSVKEGYLLKSDSKNLIKLSKSKWNKRYVVLFPDRVEWFKHSSDIKPAGQLDIQSGSLVDHFEQSRDDNVGEDTIFTVASNSDEGTRVHVFRTEDTQQKSDWLDATRATMRRRARKKIKGSVREGYLQKTDKGSKKYHQRYCVLMANPATLHYFKSINDEKQQGEIRLEVGCTIDKEDADAADGKGGKDGNPNFWIAPQPKGGAPIKKYLFSAQDLDDRARWLASLIQTQFKT